MGAGRGVGATSEANVAVIYKGHSWADTAQSKTPTSPFHLVMKTALAVCSSLKTHILNINWCGFILLFISPNNYIVGADSKLRKTQQDNSTTPTDYFPKKNMYSVDNRFDVSQASSKSDAVSFLTRYRCEEQVSLLAL